MGKRVYVYTNVADSTPDSEKDYTYGYDALGNVQVVFYANTTSLGTTGQMAYYFTQDAFGNELSGDSNLPLSNRTNLYGSSSWSAARAAGILKTSSNLKPLYYFPSVSVSVVKRCC